MNNVLHIPYIMYYEDWKKDMTAHTVIDVRTLNITVTEQNSQNRTQNLKNISAYVHILNHFMCMLF